MKTLNDIQQMKRDGEKISMVTAYDFPSAKQVEAANIDMILVGDSLGMTVLGYESTVDVTLEDMLHHSRAVRRGAPETFVVVDMPFGSVGVDAKTDIQNAIRLYKESHGNALKVEGAHLTDFMTQATQMGIPIVAHLGLTPQSVGVLGYKMQGTTKAAAQQLIQDAEAVERAGAIALVLEAIPSDLAQVISEKLTIPVIGIGAGKGTDGQVLVYHDMLNYGVERRAKFVKQYGDLSVGMAALEKYNEEVKTGVFPSEAYTYKKQIMNEVEV